jgi:subtilisin family serine protease
VLSAKAGGGLVAFSGTSMATPHVAGLCVLWWEEIGGQPIPATARTVVSRMLANARTDRFTQGVDIADRGVGLAFAPR